MLRINDSMTHFKRSKELENSMNRLFLETNPSFFYCLRILEVCQKLDLKI